MLCPHKCVLADGNTGRCLVRKNVDGVLMNLQYGYLSAKHIDPVEKKPLYHFYPGSKVLSVGGYGCNMKCTFCQNHHISQYTPHWETLKYVSPESLVSEAMLLPRNIGLAFTYNEPTVNFEYIMHTATLAKQASLKNLLITNGYIQKQPLLDLLQVVDAFNVDLKGFTQKFYKEFTHSSLVHVLHTIETLVHNNKHVEISWLLIPHANDNEREFINALKMLSTLKTNSLVLHISAYHPAYHMSEPATNAVQLLRFYELAIQYLKHVYVGNMHVGFGDNTYCSHCGTIIISRNSYTVDIKNVKNKKCTSCEAPIDDIIF